MTFKNHSRYYRADVCWEEAYSLSIKFVFDCTINTQIQYKPTQVYHVQSEDITKARGCEIYKILNYTRVDEF